VLILLHVCEVSIGIELLELLSENRNFIFRFLNLLSERMWVEFPLVLSN